MNAIRTVLALFVIVLLSGCAHPIVISPNIHHIEPEKDSERIQKNVGYFIPADLREKEVITPGGGGDKVSYKPYKDLESSFYKMLSNVFEDVRLLTSKNDLETMKKHDLSYVITPDVTTNSSSSSIVTWPPTSFSVKLLCNIDDIEGKRIASPVVMGTGRAEYSEFKSDFSLSGKRAAEDAILKMQHELMNMSALK